MASPVGAFPFSARLGVRAAPPYARPAFFVECEMTRSEALEIARQRLGVREHAADDEILNALDVYVRGRLGKPVAAETIEVLAAITDEDALLSDAYRLATLRDRLRRRP
jgi:hypothetical protein